MRSVDEWVLELFSAWMALKFDGEEVAPGEPTPQSESYRVVAAIQSEARREALEEAALLCDALTRELFDDGQRSTGVQYAAARIRELAKGRP